MSDNPETATVSFGDASGASGVSTTSAGVSERSTGVLPSGPLPHNGQNVCERGVHWSASSRYQMSPARFQPSSVFLQTEDPSLNVLAKPRLMLKPSALVIPQTAVAATTCDSERTSSDRLCDDSITRGVMGSGTQASEESSASSVVRSARLVCKPALNMDLGQTSSTSVMGGTEGATDLPGENKTASLIGGVVGDSFLKRASSVAAPSGLGRPSASAFACFGDDQSSSGRCDFVFGQNLGDRVTNAEKELKDSPAATNGGDFVFGRNVDEKVENAEKDGAAGEHESRGSGKSRSLEDAASEYERLKSSGPILPEVELVTGEEEESNVMQANSRLFYFDKERSNWVERGRGLLRLNDSRRFLADEASPAARQPAFQSRIVMRTSGILRVILNTKVWSGMLCEKVNQKSLRITGMEDGVVKVFLVTATPKDIDGLLSAVIHRIERLRRQEEAKAADDSLAAAGGGGMRKRGAVGGPLAALGESEETEQSSSPPKRSRHQDECAAAGLPDAGV